ncbi:MAG TPA: pantoate--beta-alanine ligase [Acidimicrobiia bacterium]|nr:pantoate--beta-alanine ligase [Acidimicrobiia bacterium]
MTEVTRTFFESRLQRRGLTALVPTMGYFHEGHLALMAAARQAAETVIVSLFVNPLQFNDPADLERYPRDLDRDLEMARAEKVDVVFAPSSQEMYSEPPLTRVRVATVEDHLEGPRRPGHFAGVATAVAKLFAGLQPDLAFFGRKDAQQLALVRQMTKDLSFPVTISGQPTIREHDGLALSSRNVFLGPEDRSAALTLSSGLFAAADLAEAGERDGERLVEVASNVAEGVDIEYVTLASQNHAQPLAELDRPAFLAVAARVGKVRLIDNVAFDLVSGQVIADRGRRLQTESVLYR